MAKAPDPPRLGTYSTQWVWLLEDRQLAMKRNPLICRSQRSWNARYFLWDHPNEADGASLIIRSFLNQAERRTFYPDEPPGIILKNGKRCLNVPVLVKHKISDGYESVAA
ncbi:hypothetical protein VW23_016495 [Devosia insulae DS-56]|uniref:Uncharacterized protein n=1 Tax=Devosia insulae DS-56 TaxID=1116389 RepID=A0A1E5XRZ3_9HYPH|nr:hypothetical protein VW23_016495 [Devosia insulae DS-56]